MNTDDEFDAAVRETLNSPSNVSLSLPPVQQQLDQAKETIRDAPVRPTTNDIKTVQEPRPLDGKQLEAWLKVPAKSRQVPETPFIVFKTPAGGTENLMRIEEHDLFTPSMMSKSQLGIVVDLCDYEDSGAYAGYDTREWKKYGVSYVNLPCERLSQQFQVDPPPDKVVAQFIHIVSQFQAKLSAVSSHQHAEKDKIGIHCSFGYNYTGFMVVCYLCEEVGWSVTAALNAFSSVRWPGVYDKKLINALFSRYDEEPSPKYQFPQPPKWDYQQSRPRTNNHPRDNGRPAFAASMPDTSGYYNIPAKPVLLQQMSALHPGVTVRSPHKERLVKILATLLLQQPNSNDLSQIEFPRHRRANLIEYIVESVNGKNILVMEDTVMRSPFPGEHLLMLLKEGMFVVSLTHFEIYHVAKSQPILLMHLQSAPQDGSVILGGFSGTVFVSLDLIAIRGQYVYDKWAYGQRLKFLDKEIIHGNSINPEVKWKSEASESKAEITVAMTRLLPVKGSTSISMSIVFYNLLDKKNPIGWTVSDKNKVNIDVWLK